MDPPCSPPIGDAAAVVVQKELPIEMWVLVLSFISQNMEFLFAMVCRDWFLILQRQREKRGEKLWTTWARHAVASIPHLEWALFQGGLSASIRCCLYKAAALQGKIEVIKHMAEKKICGILDGEAMALAAVNAGSIPILEWMKERARSNTPPGRRVPQCIPKEAWSVAANRGHAHLFGWLDDNNIEYAENAVEVAARAGHLDAVKALCELAGTNKPPVRDGTIIDKAAIGGHTNVIEWALQEGFQWGPCACWNAITHGHVHVLQLMSDKGFHDWADTNQASRLAATSGHIGVLRWLHENNYPLNADIAEAAACGGHLLGLKWALDKGFLLDLDRTWKNVVRAGEVDILEFLHDELGAQWSSDDIEAAAEKGRLSVLKLAVAHGANRVSIVNCAFRVASMYTVERVLVDIPLSCDDAMAVLKEAIDLFGTCYRTVLLQEYCTRLTQTKM